MDGTTIKVRLPGNLVDGDQKIGRIVQAALHARGRVSVVGSGAQLSPHPREVAEHLLDEAIRGYLLSKHIPFDRLDAWTDEIMDIVREHLAPELPDDG